MDWEEGLFSSEGLESGGEETDDKLLDLQENLLSLDGPPVSIYRPPLVRTLAPFLLRCSR